jgi:hypothetical protein
VFWDFPTVSVVRKRIRLRRKLKAFRNTGLWELGLGSLIGN